MNSTSIWFVSTGICTYVRGGFYELRSIKIETLPIPTATEEQKQTIAKLAELCQQAAEARYKKQKDLRGIIPSLHPNKRVEKLSTALQNWWQLDFAAFQMQIKKEFKQDIPVKERGDWKDQLETGTQEIERLTLEIAKHERELNIAVYALFNLTTEEIALIEQG